MIALNAILPAIWLAGLFFAGRLSQRYRIYAATMYAQGTLFVAAQTALAFGAELFVLGYIRNLGIAGFLGLTVGIIWSVFATSDSTAACFMQKALRWSATLLGLLIVLPLFQGHSTLAGTGTVLISLAVVWVLWLLASRDERKLKRETQLAAKRAEKAGTKA